MIPVHTYVSNFQKKLKHFSTTGWWLKNINNEKTNSLVEQILLGIPDNSSKNIVSNF